MTKRTIWAQFAPICLLLCFGTLEAATRDKDRILTVAQKMETAFERVVDYTCEVEQIFYQEEKENQRYRFKFYFKKEKKIRVDFSHPYSGMTILYNVNEKEATVIPLPSLPALKIQLSIDNPLLRTLAGQRINQTDMGYFIHFIFDNLNKVEQKEIILLEDDQRVEFLFWALDYIEGKFLEKYRVSVSKKEWFPIRIERYGSEGKLLEVSDIKDYRINTYLADKLFQP
jgi:outer membrane lipoprotein-sorting protein